MTLVFENDQGVLEEIGEPGAAFAGMEKFPLDLVIPELPALLAWN